MSTGFIHLDPVDTNTFIQIHAALTSIQIPFIKQVPSSILKEISLYALGQIEKCKECDEEILKLHSESHILYIIADNGVFCIDCITQNKLELCTCSKMKPVSQLKICDHFDGYLDGYICDDKDHQKCKSLDCNKSICIGCPNYKTGCNMCKGEFCEMCLCEECAFCGNNLDVDYASFCESCISSNPKSSVCVECHDCICWNCDELCCAMPQCNNRFHSLWNDLESKCCQTLCDLDCNCEELEKSICLQHTAEEICIRRTELGLIKCNGLGCNRYFCKKCMVAGNICLFCTERDYYGNVIRMLCRECCTEHKCRECNVNIHFCYNDKRCNQSNNHDLPNWYLNSF